MFVVVLCTPGRVNLLCFQSGHRSSGFCAVVVVSLVVNEFVCLRLSAWRKS